MQKRVLKFALFGLVIWTLFAIGLGVFVHFHGINDEASSADVIIVLGAGVTRNGNAGFALSRRALQAVALYNAGHAKSILCSGGQPPNRPNSEAYACQQFLMAQGIPENAIVLESRSRSTEENAVYSSEIMRERGWQTALVTTDSFHIFRARWIFAQVGIEARFSPVPTHRVNGWNVYFVSLTREVVALHWQAFKTFFNLPITYVPFI